jgi:hypothetical protein
MTPGARRMLQQTLARGEHDLGPRTISADGQT